MSLYAAYLDYFATGEGRHIFVAVAGSPLAAEKIFRANVDKFFVDGYEIVQLTEGNKHFAFVQSVVGSGAMQILERFPEQAKFFASLEYNLS